MTDRPTRPPVPREPAGHDLLAGKVAVVTAAAGTGIGSATARRLLAEGATARRRPQPASCRIPASRWPVPSRPRAGSAGSGGGAAPRSDAPAPAVVGMLVGTLVLAIWLARG